MEAELKFERENRSGIAVVGSYLIDAARRLGVEVRDESGRLGLDDSSAVNIKSGAEFLSAPTKAELEQLSDERRKNGERLASQAKIEKAGEIVVVTLEKKEEVVEDLNETYQKKFAELPLEEKISNLVKLESMALSETLSYVLSAPQAIGGKIVDVLAGFGFKLDDEAKKAAQPEEHRAEDSANEETASKQTNKKSAKSEDEEESVVMAEEKSSEAEASKEKTDEV